MPQKSIKKNFLTLGMWSFPHGTAAVQKLLYMGSALTLAGHSFTVLSHKFVRKTALTSQLQKSGEIKGIEYFTTSPYVFSPNGKLKKLYASVVGMIKEIAWTVRHTRKLDAVILYSYNFIYVALWSMYFRMTGTPVFLVYFELRSSVSHRKSLPNRINDKLLDQKSFKYTSGVYTISKLLEKQVAKYSKNTPCFSIPPLVDFDKYDRKRKPDTKYFLFCGSLAYSDVIDFIIDSFLMIKENTDANLHLVISGREEVFNAYKNKYEDENFGGRIRIFTGLTDDELIMAYINAYALLIPLRPSSQDQARFPQKIAEYCAARRPIITTAVGEIPNYFDASSAYIADDFDKNAFSLKMMDSLTNEEEAERRGNQSFETGKKHFDFKSYTIPMLNFMLKDPMAS